MKKKEIVIVGSGGLAREVRWLIEECNKKQEKWEILGWVSKERQGSVYDGLPILGDDEWLINHNSPIDVAVAIGDGKLRKKIVQILKCNRNITFPTIVAPSAEMSDSVILGEGAIVTAKSVITVDIIIGSFFFCNLCCTVGHDCRFSDFVTLNPGAHLSGNVILEECVTIGTGANVIQGITVGKNTLIGAGAVVVNNIESDCTAVGVPARPLKKKHD